MNTYCTITLNMKDFCEFVFKNKQYFREELHNWQKNTQEKKRKKRKQKEEEIESEEIETELQIENLEETLNNLIDDLSNEDKLIVATTLSKIVHNILLEL